jgi:hypothetical protein
MQKMMELSGEVLLDEPVAEDTFVVAAQKGSPGWVNRQKVVVPESFIEPEPEERRRGDQPRRTVKWNLPGPAHPPQPRPRRGSDSTGSQAPVPIDIPKFVWRSQSDVQPDVRVSPRLLDKQILDRDAEASRVDHEEWKRVAMSVKEALEMTEAENDCFGDEESEASLFVNERKVSFPVVSNEESLMYRIESIRAFLEKEIGVEKLLALHDALVSKGEDDKVTGSVIDQVDPGIVLIAQQMLILDGDMDEPTRTA